VTNLLGLLLGALALLVVGGILTLVGVIGTMIGVWRLGTLYSDTGLKVAAFLFFIPFLNVVSVFLIILGTSSALRRLTHRSSPPLPPSF